MTIIKNGTKSYLHYNKFAVGSTEDQYPLNISGFDSIGLTDPFNSFGLLNGINDLHHVIKTMTCSVIIVQIMMVGFGTMLVVD